MDLFTQLFGGVLAFVYHCFDRIVIYGYLSGLSRPERVVNFFHQVVGVPVVSREILSQRTADYQNWVEAFARNHHIPIEWAEKGVRKEDHVLPWQRRMVRARTAGLYYILKSMEQGQLFCQRFARVDCRTHSRAGLNPTEPPRSGTEAGSAVSLAKLR